MVANVKSATVEVWVKVELLASRQTHSTQDLCGNRRANESRGRIDDFARLDLRLSAADRVPMSTAFRRQSRRCRKFISSRNQNSGAAGFETKRPT
jgi:hypothetical protein